jgi:hypothetical protein
VRRMRLVQVPEQIVDKVRERFGSNHVGGWSESGSSDLSSDPPIVQYLKGKGLRAKWLSADG